MKDDKYIGNLLGALATAIATRIEQEVAVLGGRSLTHEAALVAVRNHPDDTIDTLSKTLGLTHSGAVRMINTLESEALVERHKSPQDARAVVLRVTPEGSRRADQILAARAQVTAQALGNLDEQQQQALLPALEASLSALTADPVQARNICRLCNESVCRSAGCPVESAAG